MRPLAAPPPVTRRQRVFEALGVAATPLVGFLVWKAATMTIGRGALPTEGLRVFFVMSLLLQLAVCVWPLWGRLRTERLFRRHAALLARCPACGAGADGSAACARCGYAFGEGAGWKLTSVDPFGALVLALGAFAVMGLGGMFLLGMTSAPTMAMGALVALLGALAAGFGVMLLWGAVDVARRARHTPPRFDWAPQTRLGDAREVKAQVVSGPAGATASGVDHATVWPLPAEAPALDGATPFERGLAAVFLAWDGGEHAPLSFHREHAWQWPAARAGEVAPPADAYRSAAPAADDVARSSTETWCVSFNAYSFAEALEAAGLPPLVEGASGDDALEVREAEWDVPCALVARVMAADPALRAAVEARADAADPTALGYGAALRAARSA